MVLTNALSRHNPGRDRGDGGATQDTASTFADGESDVSGSLAETPLSVGASQAAAFKAGQTLERTPGSSPRALSEFQDVGASLQRPSRSDLRTLRYTITLGLFRAA